MVETSEERVRLLKKGVRRKTLEEMYIQYNHLKLVQIPILFDFFKTSYWNHADCSERSPIKLKQTCNDSNRPFDDISEAAEIL